ncbi:MAG: hypothetical protein PVF27_01820 [Gemmatimonadales bacterium]
MNPRNALAWAVVCAALASAACGGGEEPPPAGTPAAEPPPPGEQPVGSEATPPEAAEEQAQPSQAAGAPPADTAQAEQSERETRLERETFAYEGAGRDPFLSLIRTGAVRPRLQDLRVTTINYNERYPGNSVAVLRDTTVNARYTVRVGDELGRGRIRIAAIRPEEVTVIIEQLGVERQEVLRLRRRQQED